MAEAVDHGIALQLPHPFFSVASPPKDAQLLRARRKPFPKKQQAFLIQRSLFYHFHLFAGAWSVFMCPLLSLAIVGVLLFF
jgi:hypothetical protein